MNLNTFDPESFERDLMIRKLQPPGLVPGQPPGAFGAQTAGTSSPASQAMLGAQSAMSTPVSTPFTAKSKAQMGPMAEGSPFGASASRTLAPSPTPYDMGGSMSPTVASSLTQTTTPETPIAQYDPASYTGNTGITGGMTGPGNFGTSGMLAPGTPAGTKDTVGNPTTSGTTPGTTPAGGLGQYANQLEGFDQGKLASGHDSPKYQFARVASNYNPREGVTSAMLADLNKLGIGTFSGSGDHLHIDNPDPRFEGITDFDVVRDIEGSGGWTWQPLNGGGGGDGGGSDHPAGAGSPLGGYPGSLFGVNSAMLGGNPIQSIEALLSDETRRQMLQQLMGLAPGWKTPGAR